MGEVTGNLRPLLQYLIDHFIVGYSAIRKENTLKFTIRKTNPTHQNGVNCFYSAFL